MDAKTIAVSVVSIAIACLFAVTLLIPIIADSTAETDTFTNEGYYRMAEYDNTASFSAKWDHTDPNAFTIDGVKYELPTTQQSIDLNLMCGQTFFLRYNQFSGYAYVQTYGDTIGGSYIARSDQNQDMTITVSGGNAVFDNGGGSPKTVPYTTMYAVSGDGEYILKHSTDNAYVLGNSTIIAVGHSSNNIDTFMIGTIDDGFIRDYRSPSSPGDEVTNFTFSDVVVDDTVISSHVNLYTLLKFTWTATNNDTSQTSDIIYSQFLVPYQVTAERSIHPDASTNALLNIIPLLVVMGIILGTVGIIAMRK